MTNQFAGVTFSPNLYYDPQDGTQYGIAGILLGNFSTDQFINPVTISFASPVDGAPFQMAADVTPFSFVAYNGSTVVDSGASTVSYPSRSLFYGAPDQLTSIVITQTGAGGGPYYLLGNLQEGASVPETGAAALALADLGLLDMVLTLRRRRAV